MSTAKSENTGKIIIALVWIGIIISILSMYVDFILQGDFTIFLTEEEIPSFDDVIQRYI